MRELERISKISHGFQTSLTVFSLVIPFLNRFIFTEFEKMAQVYWLTHMARYLSAEHDGVITRKVKVKSLSHVWLFAIPWTVVYQASLSMGFSSQEYWSGLPFPSPGDLPDPGIEPRSPALQADALPSEPPGKWVVWHNQKKKKTHTQMANSLHTNHVWMSMQKS